jgi:hypothetical protein
MVAGSGEEPATIRYGGGVMIVRCKIPFHAPGHIFVREGDLFDSKDPVVKDRMEFFESVEDVVERMTAAPGEKRTLKKHPRSKYGQTDAGVDVDAGDIVGET